jgi:RNA polymerase sigma factor (sigma-70 family)
MAYRNRTQLRDFNQLGSWLCGIARNLARDVVRRSSQRNRLQSAYAVDERQSSDDPAMQSISQEESELVWTAIEAVPETYREVLVMYYRHGESVAEVAQRLGISEDAVKQRLSRGREHLRTQLTMSIEGVLRRASLTPRFTKQVLTVIGVMGASLSTTSVASASAGVAATTTATVAGSTVKGAAASASAWAATGVFSGLWGGLMGGIGGLLGAFLGTWMPSQMAIDREEQLVLRRQGQRAWRAGLYLTLLTLLTIPLAFFDETRRWYFLVLLAISLAWGVWIMYLIRVGQRELQQLQQRSSDERVIQRNAINRHLFDEQGRSLWIGRNWSSRLKLFGVPLCDIQFADPGGPNNSESNSQGHAWGWIALGDAATGILLAVGGRAFGTVAVGGLASGVLAVGGMAVGVLSAGGCAVGFWLALGGLAIGWDAVGGGAIGWHSAVGGAAVAKHVAVGGAGWSYEYGVGPEVTAAEANSEMAHTVAAAESWQWLAQWLLQNQAVCLVVTIVISIAPMVLMPMVYRRRGASSLA